MTNIREYWAAVRRETANLPEFPWVTSLDDPSRGMVGGCTTQVSRETAGELLVQKSHRIASEEEVAAFWKRCEEQAAKYAEIERKRLLNSLVHVPEQQPTKGKK